MKNNKLFGQGLLHASGVLVYVLAFSAFMSRANDWFGKTDRDIVTPAAALMLFVFSALVTGGLVLGRPLLLYIDGQKKEGVKLLLFTGLGLFLFTILTFVVLFFLNR